ncbi:MAG: methyltransferase domain-containing protein [Pyrinomonadaceae bacterium]
MNEWLRSRLVCPRDKEKLENKDENLICPLNHIYPIVEGIPVMLVNEAETTHGYIGQTLEKVAALNDKRNETENETKRINEVDEFVQSEIPYTSGILYIPLKNKLTRYPIPEFRLPPGNGEKLLDIGCNWGRWSIAAGQRGYQPIGIDPSLNAVVAARRVSKQLGVNANFVVGDARFLPFATDCFDVVFSYGVFQHFSKENVRISLDEIVRVLKKDGKTLFQMPNKYGMRSFYQQWRRGFTEGEGFEVRYWTPSELLETFKEKFGETEMTTDCYFGLGIQKSDVDMLPLPYKIVVHSSDILRKVSRKIAPMIKVADSVYLESVNENNK